MNLLIQLILCSIVSSCISITILFIWCCLGRRTKSDDSQVEKIKREKNRLLKKIHQQPLPVKEGVETYQVKDIPNQIWSSVADLEMAIVQLELAMKVLPREKNAPEELRLLLIKILGRLRDL